MTRTTLLYATLLSAALAGCKKGSPPEFLDEIEPQRVSMNQELTLELAATDPDGDSLSFGFSAPSNLKLDSADASMKRGAFGQGVFKFKPRSAEQVGDHSFEFSVSDGNGNTTAMPVLISVVGGEVPPSFLEPSEEGGVFASGDPTKCFEVPIEIDDPDTSTVTLGLDEIPNAELADLSDDGKQATLRFCPAEQQRRSGSQLVFRLTADDGESQVAKTYLLLMLTEQNECMGSMMPPVVDHTPVPYYATTAQLEASAGIQDDGELKQPPVLCYTFEDPRIEEDGAVYIDVSNMVASPMELTDGTKTDGNWTGYMTNPTANQGTGAQATIYYLVNVTDADGCNTETDLAIVDVSSNGGQGAALCAPCELSANCGSSNDLCVNVNGASFCAKACNSNADCPNDFECSAVNPADGGAPIEQCVPKSGSCTGGSCQDDTREEDDSQGSAKPIGVGESINAHMCPADADWHSFTLASSGNVTVTLSGAPEVDLDIALQNSSGQTVGFSANTGSQEEIVASSLAAGTYFVEVFPYQPSEPQSDYQLTVMTGGSTGGAECCGDTCDDGTIRDCVCLNWDEECCNGWDAGCASAVNLCDDACQATDSDPSCCAMHPEPRCDNNAVERCVCIDNGMTACCSVGWTQDCVTKATQCGASC